MEMKRLFIIPFLSAALTQMSASEQYIDDTFLRRKEYAENLNNKGHYIEAFDSLRVLNNEIKEILSGQYFNSEEYEAFYMNSLVSQAQCAYKVNLWNEIKSICDEMTAVVTSRKEKNPEENIKYNWSIATYFKTKGDYCYLKGLENGIMYNFVQNYYDEALKYYQFDDRFNMSRNTIEESIVYADFAQLQYLQGDYSSAIKNLEFALKKINNRRIENTHRVHSLRIEYQSALAMCLARSGKYDDALNYMDVAVSLLPKSDNNLPELQRRKGKILLLQNENKGTDIGDACRLYDLYFKSIRNNVNNNFIQMTADQREEYWMSQRPFVADCYLLEDRAPELLYDLTLYNKGILLQTGRSFYNLLSKEEQNKINLLKQLDYQHLIKQQPTTLAEDYEKKLLHTMSFDGRLKKFFNPLNHTWKEVQKALPVYGCAIEFVEYEKRNSMYFGALILKKTGKPQFIQICNAEELADYSPDLLYSLKTLMSSTNGISKNEIYKDDFIRDAIWNGKLISAIGDCKKVYFSTDGYLHQLAIEYMLPEQLQDKEFYRLSSTRVLVEGNKIDSKKIKNGAAFVLGGIVYDSFFDDDDNDPGNDIEAFNTLQEKGVSFAYMKGAKLECDSIIYYRNNPNDLYLDSLRATEQAFYKNSTKYPIMHISTHGCFSGDLTIYDELLASSTKDVLSESVMALSNAGTHLRNKRFDASNKDGLISAREIARLNLENVELITTSACQTGLGYITADGIYGIQRGLKSAGVKGMVLSLWSVNVESARIFFTSLYKYIGEGESVNKAFNHARNDLLTKTYTTSSVVSKFNNGTLNSKEIILTTTNKYDKPQHSCPYILIDAWE